MRVVVLYCYGPVVVYVLAVAVQLCSFGVRSGRGTALLALLPACRGRSSSLFGRLPGSFRCWFVKKYCWLVCVREKYYFGWKFTIVYDKPQPNEQAGRE